MAFPELVVVFGFLQGQRDSMLVLASAAKFLTDFEHTSSSPTPSFVFVRVPIGVDAIAPSSCVLIAVSTIGIAVAVNVFCAVPV